MKFKSITLYNFMRFKGQNTIEFACDEDKNVTVVLGDNTDGKTVLAQAFRWGLYGVLLKEKGRGNGDYTLLNKDVITEMDENTRASVWVEIIIENDNKIYKITREKAYNRRYPTLNIVESYKKINLKWYDEDKTEYVVEGNDKLSNDKIAQIINGLLPMELSDYFLFDGERWNEFSGTGFTKQVKKSVDMLTGIQTIHNAMYHLKDMSMVTSVIGKMSGNIKGGAVYDSLLRDIKKNESEIKRLQDKIAVNENNIAISKNEIEKIEIELEENKGIEENQKAYKLLEANCRTKEQLLKSNYEEFVKRLSEKGYMYMALPMVEQCKKMLKNASIERRDVPFMKQASIDYLLKRQVCLCGTKIEKDSKELECLLEQRAYLPPADLGSLLGDFEKIAKRWNNRVDGFIDEMETKAVCISETNKDIEDLTNEMIKLKDSMLTNIDFKERHEKIKKYNNEINNLNRENGKNVATIEGLIRNNNSKEREIEEYQKQNKENEKWIERLNVAKAIYADLKEDYDKKEKEVFNAFNTKIKEKFGEMFNAKDKKIQLDKNYNIQLLYKMNDTYVEEKNLSEGEKVARNFAFITTVMEYSKEQKKKGDKDVDTLPIVLDGPFSKLSAENITLIANTVPKIAEQVIIFMLKKDWVYTNLDEYVGKKYMIHRPLDKGSSKIIETGGEE